MAAAKSNDGFVVASVGLYLIMAKIEKCYQDLFPIDEYIVAKIFGCQE